MPSFIDENIVRIQISMCNTSCVEMGCGSGDAEEDGLAFFHREDGIWMEGVTCAAIQSGWKTKIGVVWWDELKNQSLLIRMAVDLANWVDEIGMLASSDTRVHFVHWGSIGCDFAFEELDCDVSVVGLRGPDSFGYYS